jgi:hypothetical protein
MITYTNRQRHRRQRTRHTLHAVALTSALVIFASILVMVATFTLAPTLVESPLIIAILGTLSTLTGLQAGKVLATRPDPVEAFDRALKGLSSDTTLYNYYLPADNVLLTPSAAYVLYPVPHQGKLTFENGALKLSSRPLRKIAQSLLLGNPSKAFTTSIKLSQAAKLWLEQEAGVDIPVHPLLVLTHADTELELVEQPPIPVLLASKQKPSLKAHVRDQPSDKPSDEQLSTVQTINDLLGLPDE